jgi:hypothetical protein
MLFGRLITWEVYATIISLIISSNIYFEIKLRIMVRVRGSKHDLVLNLDRAGFGKKTWPH